MLGSDSADSASAREGLSGSTPPSPAAVGSKEKRCSQTPSLAWRDFDPWRSPPSQKAGPRFPILCRPSPDGQHPGPRLLLCPPPAPGFQVIIDGRFWVITVERSISLFFSMTQQDCSDDSLSAPFEFIRRFLTFPTSFQRPGHGGWSLDMFVIVPGDRHVAYGEADTVRGPVITSAMRFTLAPRLPSTVMPMEKNAPQQRSTL